MSFFVAKSCSPKTDLARYDPELTAMLRYIMVTVPSAGENKCTVLRNIVGAIGCMPKVSCLTLETAGHVHGLSLFPCTLGLEDFLESSSALRSSWFSRLRTCSSQGGSCDRLLADPRIAGADIMSHSWMKGTEQSKR